MAWEISWALLGLGPRGLCRGMGHLRESLSRAISGQRRGVRLTPPMTRPLPVPGHGVLRGRGPANAAEQVWGADPGRNGALLSGRDCHGHRLSAPAGLCTQVGAAGAEGRGLRAGPREGKQKLPPGRGQGAAKVGALRGRGLERDLIGWNHWGQGQRRGFRIAESPKRGPQLESMVPKRVGPRGRAAWRGGAW